MDEMLETEMLLGLGAVALWTHLRLPRLRPRSIGRAAIHLAISFLAFALLPTELGYLLPLAGTPRAEAYVALALLMPATTYLLLSWIWLIDRVVRDLLDRTPRGGHPVSDHH